MSILRALKRQVELKLAHVLKTSPIWWVVWLFPVSFFYRVFSFFRQKKKKIRHQQAVTVCIGNITLGGNGKTPFLIHLAQDLKDQRLAIISKGYGRKTKQSFEVQLGDRAEETGDEPLLMKQQLPNRKVALVSSRLESLKIVGQDVLLFDDGLQESQLGYDYRVALFDERQFFGPSYLIPAGNYREPFSSLSEVDLIGIKGKLSEKAIQKAQDKLKSFGIKPNFFVFSLKPDEVKPICSSSSSFDLDQLTVAFCAIGEPDSFFSSLEEMSVKLLTKIVLADHEPWVVADWEKEMRIWKQQGVTQLICTKKDAIKLRDVKNCALPIFFLETKLTIDFGKEHYLQFLNAVQKDL